jgi:plasmid stabilization system protein ParE
VTWRVVWSVAALDDLDGIFRYLLDRNPDAAWRLRDQLVAASFTLAEMPLRGRPADGNHRELVTLAPYLIRYRIAGDEVRILRIRHAARHRTFAPQ